MEAPRWDRWKAERHARLVVLYERFYTKFLDPGFLNPPSHMYKNLLDCLPDLDHPPIIRESGLAYG